MHLHCQSVHQTNPRCLVLCLEALNLLSMRLCWMLEACHCAVLHRKAKTHQGAGPKNSLHMANIYFDEMGCNNKAV